MLGFVYGYATARVRWLFSASARGENKRVETSTRSRRGTGAVEYICVMGLILVMSIGLVSSFGGAMRRIWGGSAAGVNATSGQVAGPAPGSPQHKQQKRREEIFRQRAQIIAALRTSGSYTLIVPETGESVTIIKQPTETPEDAWIREANR